MSKGWEKEAADLRALLTPEEMKAAASGNPLVLEEMNLRKEVKRLENEASAHRNDQFRTREMIRMNERYIEETTERADQIEKDIGRALPEEFEATIRGETYDKRRDAGAAIIEQALDMEKSGAESALIGKFGDFKIRLARRRLGNFSLALEGDGTYWSTMFTTAADPQGVALRLSNVAKEVSNPGALRDEVKRLETTNERLRKQVAEWPKAADLAAKKAQHGEIIGKLRAKDKPKEAPKAEEPKFSVTPAKSAAWRKHLERLRAGTASLDDFTLIDQSPILSAVLGGRGEVVMNRLRFAKIVKDHGDIPDNVWNFLPQLIANPRFAFVSRDDAATIVLIGKMESDVNVVVGLRKDGQILTVTPWNNMPGETSEDRVARAVSSALKRPGTVYAISKNVLGEAQQRTGSNSPAQPGSRVGKPHQGRAKIVFRDAFVNKSSVGSPEVGDGAGAVRDSLTGGPDGEVISRLIDAGRVVIHDDASTLPDGVTAPDGVQGVTMPDGTIHLVAGNLTAETARGVLLHEMFHAGARPLVGNRAWTELLKRVGTMADRAMEREAAGEARGSDAFWKAALDRARAAGTSEAHMAEEVAAYAIENADSAPMGLRAIVVGLIGRLKAWALRTFGAQIGEVTPGQLRALAVSALRSRENAPTGGPGGGLRFSVGKAADADITSGWTNARNTISRALTAAMAGAKSSEHGKVSALALVPLRGLLTEMGKRMPSARLYLDKEMEMRVMRAEGYEKASAIIDPWAKADRKDKATNQKLMDLMHASTLAQVDPSKPLTKEQAGKLSPEEKALRAEFHALPAAEQQRYMTVRDASEAVDARLVCCTPQSLEGRMTASCGIEQMGNRRFSLQLGERMTQGPDDRSELMAVNHGSANSSCPPRPYLAGRQRREVAPFRRGAAAPRGLLRARNSAPTFQVP